MKTSNKKIPKSLKECCETDYVAKDLWSWSWKLEAWGRKLMIAMIVIGAVSSFLTFVMTIDALEEVAIANFFASIIKWTIYVIFTYVGYHMLSILIASLATVVQNTRVIADVALYKASAEEVFEDEKTITEEVAETEIRYEAPVNKVKLNSDGTWACNNCGVRNTAESLYCKDCGKYR